MNNPAMNPAEEADESAPPMENDETDIMGGANEVCVDTAALAMPDEGDNMTPPAVGDKVQMNIEGEVSRMEGNKAYVTMTAVNGQEVKAEQAPASDDQQFSELQGMAGKMPPEY